MTRRVMLATACLALIFPGCRPTRRDLVVRMIPILRAVSPWYRERMDHPERFVSQPQSPARPWPSSILHKTGGPMPPGAQAPIPPGSRPYVRKSSDGRVTVSTPPKTCTSCHEERPLP